MNDKQLMMLAESTKQHFIDIGWAKHDVDAALRYVTHTLLLLMAGDMPITSPKYHEVLRHVANVLQLMEKENTK